MTSPAVEQLQLVGMTEWEARVYLALLEEAPASGYSVAKRSNVPRSKVYEVLNSLTAKGAVHVAHGATAAYRPLPPKELIEKLRRETTENLDAAASAMAQFAEQIGTDPAIWDLQGRIEILNRARQLIRVARQRILVEIWAPDAEELRPELAEAANRGVQVTAVSYGDPGYAFAEVYAHPSTDEVTTGLGGRWLVISADDREVVAGIVSSGAQSRAAWTSHPALVVPITELITHDIYKLEMLAARRSELEQDFGPGLIRLRQKFAVAEQREPPGHTR